MKRLVLALSMLLLLGFPFSALRADGVMYMDEAGNIFFVDSPSQVPERYRYQLTPVAKPLYLDEKSQKDLEKATTKKQRQKEKDEKRKSRIDERERKKKEKEDEVAKKKAEKAAKRAQSKAK